MANETTRCVIDDVQKEIDKLLQEYGDEVRERASKVAHITAKDAAVKLKQNGVGNFKNKTGRYRAGWRANISKGRTGFVATTYNVDAYQLTHLLEYGHAVYSWGSYSGDAPAYPHIYAVNEWAQREFIAKLQEELNEKG